ncbi:hypothetical protein [Methylobacterium platani]|uniref:Uncharacterized protein n=2 Tax=Methylobacterium platani TaxID=427683 RepID=A0A179RXQ9_9HYPH|nr:hypothetical protein [Methylobacterium platani]KMO10078.1 hypothetical protein SQ03_31050 [Methylobacterium platani JCM 14648]OAS13884.1 hypothetical protein A5481_30955 [Methylobacterium platani]
MTEGERFVRSLPAKTDFHDRSKRRSYALTRAVAIRIIDDPGLVENGRHHLDRFMQGDPRQARYYSLWTDLLRQDVEVIARRMLEDSAEGDILRDTQPVFVVLSPRERSGLGANATAPGGAEPSAGPAAP